MQRAVISVIVLSGLLLPTTGLKIENQAKDLAEGGDVFCKVGYSCVTGANAAATKCICQMLGYLHESAMPYDDKLGMLQALQDKNEDKLVRMRFRQTSRNLLMNMFGSNRNSTEHIAELTSGTCEQSGYAVIELKSDVPLGIGEVKLHIQNVDEKLFNYRKAKIQNVAPAVAQAAQYGERMSKDIFLQAEGKKCIAGDTTTPNLVFGD